MGAFADSAEKEAGGALQYYADISHPLHVIKTAVYVVQTTLGDSVVVRSLFCSPPCIRLVLRFLWSCGPKL